MLYRTRLSKTHMSILLSLLAGIVCLLSLAIPALGQNITGTITGVVADPSGAGIPQAPVTALDTDTGISYKTTTGAEGVYVLPLLPVGAYRVTVEAQGFRKFVSEGLHLGGDERLRVDARLELGSVAEQVTVSAGSPLVSTDQATLGTSFTASSFDNLPIGRAVQNMMNLVAGTQANAQGIVVGNINGSRDTVVDVKIDGTPATHTGNGLVSASPPIVELVEEVVVQTSSYSAEFGHGVGQVNFTTRGGANQPRGTLIYYFENNDLSANGFMNNFYGFKRAILRYNLYGGTFSGPVILPKIYDGRNRTFFSFGYEGSQTRSFAQSVSTVPSAAMRAGDFSGLTTIYDPSTTQPSGTTYTRSPFPGNTIPASRVSALATNMLGVTYPLPTLPGTANNYVNFGSDPGATTAYNVRGDHNFSDKSRLTGRYTYQLAKTQSLPTYPGPAGAALTGYRYQYIVSAEHVYVFRPDLVNNFHFGYYRMLNLTTPTGANGDWSSKLGLQNLAPYTFPAVTITGLSGFGGGSYVVRPQSNNYQFLDSLTWIKGRHALKMGVEYRQLQYGNWSGTAASGSFAFNTLPTLNPLNRTGGLGFASFLLGIPSTTTASAVQPVPAGSIIENWKNWSAFLQDDYKVTSNLTLNLGLRWDMFTPRTVAQNRQSEFDLKTLQLDYAGQNGYPDTLYNYNWRDFQPRVGFAYTPFGNTRTVFRGGYGIFFQDPNQAISGFEAGPWNPSFTFTSPDNGITFPLTLSTAVPPISLNAPYVLSTSTAVFWIPRNFKDANSQQWSLNIQRELRPGFMVEIGYVGSRGVHLPLTYQLNQVPTDLLGPGNAQSRRPYPTVGSVEAYTNPVGNSTYNALQARLERRIWHGVSWLAVYTFSKSFDDASGFASSRSFGVVSVQNNYDLAAERSVSAFDVPNNFVSSLIWNLPVGKGRMFLNRGGVLNALIGGWTVSGITSLQSGRPLVMTTVTNLTGSLDGGSRPNRLRNGALSGAERTRLRWFDPSAFALPAAFTWGDDSRTEPDIRGPGAFNIDTLLAKEFHLTESVSMQFRMEAYNALNHFNPGTPNSTIGAPGVGTITTGNAGRVVQLALKLMF